MSQIYNTIELRRNKYLSLAERYKIEAYFNDGKPAFKIAKILGRDRRTIEREIARGKISLQNTDGSFRIVYCADVAQRKYEESAKNKGASIKLGNDHELAAHIEQKIGVEKYSPDAVLGEIKEKGLKFKTIICTKTLYNYIDKGIFLNISNKDLVVKKDKRIRMHRKVNPSQKNPHKANIDERPQKIDDRIEQGHWEMDCVEGKKNGSKATLLVLSERVSRREIIIKMPDKTQESVIRALDELELRYWDNFREIFKTITTDNGCEFLNYDGIERSLLYPENKRTKMYFAHPYSSWERGTNENINKMIRRFIPKGVDIGDFTDEEIKRIELWINNYPRKILGYKSALDVCSIAC